MTVLQMVTPLGLAGVVAKGTLLLAIGWCGTLLLRPAPALARHLIWLTAIIGVLLIPVLARIAPMNVAMLPSVPVVPDVSPMRDVKTAAVQEPAITPVIAPSASSARASSARTWLPNPGGLAVAVWLTAAIALLIRFVAGMLTVGRIVRRGRALHSPDWMRALGEATARLNLEVRPRLVMSDQVEMAFAFGAFASTIIVPVSAEEWSYDRRRAVLLHELAHIRRRDLVGHALASIACAVYWFNPFVWVAARRLRVESELASDDVVLESGVRPADYAQHLLDLVTSVGQRAPTVALAMARPKEFEGRLVAILDRANERRAFGRTQRGAMVGLFGLLTMSIAAVVPVPRRSEVVKVFAATPTPRSSEVSARDSSTGVGAKSRDGSRAALTTARPETAPMLSDVAVSTLLRFGTAGVINPMIMLLRASDSLHLTGVQADSIATLNRAYLVRLSTIWSPVSTYYVAHPAGDESSMTAGIRRAPRASMDALIDLVPNVAGLLTDDQRRKLPPGIAVYLDTRYLAAIGAGQTSAPGGVFLPNGGMYGGGRRGGGGSGARGGDGRVGRGGT
jgi:beta-lactamase regulating signal transducer with metallopeptidase domain